MPRTKKAPEGATITKHVGLDVHKETIAVAVACDGEDREVRFHGTIANTPEAVRRLVSRLAGPWIALSLCYEAGPCGYGLHRQLTEMGHPCMVIAPSMMPRRPGDCVKTDRRDAMTLARLLRAGELEPVWVPDEGHEAMRDLVRARRGAKEDLIAARQSLLSFLLRHGRRYTVGRKRWTCAFWRWLGEQAFASPHQQLVFGEHLRRIEEAQARVLSARRGARPTRSRAGASRRWSAPSRPCAASGSSSRRRWSRRSVTSGGSPAPSS